MKIELIQYALVFFLGASIGSFLTVCIYRIPVGLSIISPPSACDSCGRRLGALDMIPVLSGLLLCGKCRHCGSKFPLRSVFIEILTGTIFAFLFWKYFGAETMSAPEAPLAGQGANGILNYLATTLFISYMIVIAFIDYDHGKILNSTIFFGVLIFGIIFLIESIIGNNSLILKRLVYSLSAFSVFLLLHLLFNKVGMIGMGDVKLMSIIGMVFLEQSIYIITASLILALLYSLILLGLKKKTLKSKIRLGPFFSMTAIVYVLL